MLLYYLNMFLGNSDTRERIRWIDRTTADTIAALQLPSVREELGESNAEGFRLMAENLYHPNIKDNVVSVPKTKQNTDLTPAIALRPGESIYLGETFAAMSPLQQKNLVKIAKGWVASDVDDAVIDSFPSHIESRLIDNYRDGVRANISMGARGLGVVATPSVVVNLRREAVPNVGKDLRKIFTGRPILSLALRGSFTRGSRSAILVHELEHVAQSLVRPFYPYDKNRREDELIRRELEAYSATASFGIGLYQSGKRLYQNDKSLLAYLPLDNLRRKHTPLQDPFYPSPALKRAIYEAGIDMDIDLGQAL